MKSFPKLITLHLLFITLLTVWASDHIFFWDTISQGSRLVDFYYQNNFKSLILPPEIDQGHPPLFQIYLAAGWKIFGRTLFVSHFLMLPILAGIVWQFWHLTTHFFEKKHHLLALTLPFFDTTFLAQSILVSPDILLLFAFLLSLNGILKKKNGMIAVGCVILGLTSIRGIVMVGILFLIRIFFQARDFSNFKNLKNLIQQILPFIPALTFTLFWLTFHYLETGWLISTPNESWGNQRSFVGISGVLKNVAVAGWRLIDFGKIGIWIVLGIWLIRGIKKFPTFRNLENLKKFPNQLALILFTFLTVNIGLFMWFSNPLAHRYFLPAFVIQILLVGYLLLEKKMLGKASKPILWVVLVVMFSGNFWVYPDKVAQGWDGTAAHVPYYDLRENMLEFMIENQIPFSETGTEFPNKSHFDELSLSGQKEGMTQKDFSKHRFIFYSNVMNDFSDEDLLSLNENWKVKKQFAKRGVKIILYEKSAD